MDDKKAKKLTQKLLDFADVKIGGDRHWDIQVKNDSLFSRVLRSGSVGLGESYMDDWWDAEKLDEFFEHILRARIDKKILGDWKTLVLILSHIVFNMQKKSKSFEVGEKHYDLGNDIFEAMLDKRMIYSCGYWNPPAGGVNNLDEAQDAKLDLICRKIGLKPGQAVLDIGCGWGGFAKYAAEKYGTSVTGVTVSKEQASLARELCQGLPVEIIVQDYREIKGKFDHIVSIGMFEHVGYKNYREFFRVASEHLKDDGLFLLHTIGTNITTTSTDPWIMKYIFPSGMLPSPKHITETSEGIFKMEDWHNFGVDYDKTVMAWFEKFDAAWPRLKEKYSERFYRMWKYYLMGAAATFRVRDNQLWQIVLSKDGIKGGYKSIR
jgi:cyclopropane-fatty-acyl-phospholipid synthase